MKEFYGVEISSGVLGAFTRSLKGGREDVVRAGLARESHELHKIALETMMNFKADLDDARQGGDLKRIQIINEAFNGWWDRVGKFHFKDKEVQQPLMQLNQFNTQILLEEAKNNPEIAKRITARLLNGQATDGPQDSSSSTPTS